MDEGIESHRASYESGLSSQQRELLKAVEIGSLDEVEKLLDGLSSQEKQGQWFDYVLVTTAVEKGHKSITEFLLKSDCRVRAETKTQFLCTPLYYAFEQNDSKTAEALITRGASIHDTDANDKTPLDLAVQNERFELIDVVLRNREVIGAIRNLDPSCRNDTALFHMACYRCQPHAMKEFLDRGFSVHSRSTFDKEDWIGFTPLHFTLSSHKSWSYEQSVELLLKHDVDFSAQDQRGNTPIHIAFKNQDLGYSCFLNDPKILKKWIRCLTVKKLSNIQDQNGLSHFHIICCGSDECNDTVNCIDAIQYFLDSGVDVNSSVSSDDPSYPEYTALHFAVRNFRFDIVKLLLDKGADPKKTDKNGLTPLHVACDYLSVPRNRGYTLKERPSVSGQDRLKIVELLLKYGADVEATDLKGGTPLHYSFYGKGGDEEPLTRPLLSKIRLNSNLTDSHGLSYLHIASSMNFSATKTLIERGASVNSRVNSDAPRYSGYSALHFAVSFNEVKIVQYLLKNGADANVKTGVGRDDTPLHIASSCKISHLHDLGTSLLDISGPNDALKSYLKDRNGIIESLIKHGASINEKNSFGNTPLLIACTIPIDFGSPFGELSPDGEILKQIYSGQRSTVQLLLRHGADIHQRNNERETVLLVITGQGELKQQKVLCEIMLKRGADINAGDENGTAPVHYAVIGYLNDTSTSDLSLLRLFCKYGVDINAQGTYSCTPLHRVAEDSDLDDSKCVKILEFILDHPEVDVNAKDRSGNTPLHAAAKEQKDEFSAEHYLEHFPWFSQDRASSLPKFNNYPCIDKLLSAGADIHAENLEGLTPFDLLYKWLMENSSCSERYYTDMYVSVLTHLKKLMRMNASVGERCREKFNALSKIRPQISPAVDRLLNREVDQLKSTMIDPHTTLFEILVKDSYSVAKHVKNENLKKILESSKFCTDYILLHGMLIRQFKRGWARNMILEPAKEALKIVSQGINLSVSCVDHILKYLEIENLQNLIKATSAGQYPKIPGQNSLVREELQLKIRRSQLGQHWISTIEMCVMLEQSLLRNQM